MGCEPPRRFGVRVCVREREGGRESKKGKEMGSTSVVRGREREKGKEMGSTSVVIRREGEKGGEGAAHLL